MDLFKDCTPSLWSAVICQRESVKRTLQESSLLPTLSIRLPPKISQIKSKDNYFFSRLNLIAKTPLEDWMWYLTFIWATLGITSSFILQSVTLQWSFPGLQSCPGPLADILAPYARAAPGPGQRQHINNAPQCEFDLVFLLCGAYSPFLGRENMTLVCPQTTFPALSETTTAHPELPIHCSIMGLSQCFGTCLLQFLLLSVALPQACTLYIQAWLHYWQANVTASVCLPVWIFAKWRPCRLNLF